MDSRVAVGPAASMAEVDRDEWDALAAAHTLYSSHRWLTYGERLGDCTSAHLVARAGERLVGALPVYRLPGALPHFYDPAVLFPEVEPMVRAPGALILGGTRLGYTSELLVAPDLAPDEQDRLAAATLHRFRALRERDEDLLAMLYLTDDSVDRLLPHLRPRDALVLIDARARLPVPASGLAGYRELISGRRWAAVRKEMRRFAAAGCRVAVSPFATCYHLLAPLSAQVLRRYGHPLTEEDEKARFRQQAELVQEDCWVVGAYRGDRMVGFTQFFTWGDVWYGRIHGVDDEIGRTASVYFMTTYYAALDAAAARGLRHLDLSCDALDAKVARGARLDPLWALVLDAPWPAGQAGAVRAAEQARLDRFAAIDPRIRTGTVRRVAERG